MKDHEEVAYKRLKPMEIIKPSDPNSVVAVAITGGGRLLEVPTVSFHWESFGVLFRWSLTKGSHS